MPCSCMSTLSDALYLYPILARDHRSGFDSLDNLKARVVKCQHWTSLQLNAVSGSKRRRCSLHGKTCFEKGSANMRGSDGLKTINSSLSSQLKHDVSVLLNFALLQNLRSIEEKGSWTPIDLLRPLTKPIDYTSKAQVSARPYQRQNANIHRGLANTHHHGHESSGSGPV